MEEIPKIMLVNKPVGITSFDVIRILRNILGIKKIGHAGTLDPNASGLMILGINDGTKKLSELILNDKTYEAEILLGVKTDSGDTDGNILQTNDVRDIQIEEIEKVVKKMLGAHTYKVPEYSAIKIDGKKMYELARNNEKIEPVFREMNVYEISNISYKKPYIKLTLHVSKGTYIRSLAEFIGNELGLPSTLSNLKRISIGNFKLEDAIDLPQQSIDKIKNKKHH